MVSQNVSGSSGGEELSLTLGAHAQRGLRYLVCVSVCVSVTQHLVFIRATNGTNLLGGG